LNSRRKNANRNADKSLKKSAPDQRTYQRQISGYKMNFLSPKTIKEILSRYSAAPAKRFGQNFLINPGVLKKIIEAAALERGDTVLEIGPGIGTLTQELARQAKKVVAIEKDRKMVEILKETLENYKNVGVIQADILKFPINSLFVIPARFTEASTRRAKAGIQVTDPRFHGDGSGSRVTRPNASGGQEPGMAETRYKLVANLPYYITSPVIRKFLETKNQPSEMILMVQKEVAQRICAKPPDMSLLAVSVQFYAEPKIVSYVSKGSFWPSPKVDSAIIKITPKSRLPLLERGIKGDFTEPQNPPQSSPYQVRGKLFAEEGTINFFRIVHAGFSAPRKQLAGNLSKGLKLDRKIILAVLENAKIEPERRAETLTVEEWSMITNLLLS